MLNVLVTMRFDQAQLDRLRAVSPEISVSQADPDTADYAKTHVLYAGAPPRDLSRAPALRWVQLHMAGVNALADHPLYTETALPLTTTSGVHAATIAEYAVTMLLALAHRVPRMLEWQGRGGWPPDEQRWPLFVPSEVRGATLGIIGYGSIGRELARIAKSAFGMTVLAGKRDPSRRADDAYCLPGTGDPEGRLPDEWLGMAELDALLARSDVVVLCAPLTADPRADRGGCAAAHEAVGLLHQRGTGRERRRGRADPCAARAVDRGRGPRRLRPGAAGRGASVLRARQRHPLASRLRLPAELRREVLGALRREPPPPPGRGADAEPGGSGARLLEVTCSSVHCRGVLSGRQRRKRVACRKRSPVKWS